MLTSKLRWLSSTTAGARGGVWRIVADRVRAWLASWAADRRRRDHLAMTRKQGRWRSPPRRLETELANGLADGIGGDSAARRPARARLQHPRSAHPMTATATTATLTALAATMANWRRWPPTSANRLPASQPPAVTPVNDDRAPYGCQMMSPICGPRNPQPKRDTPMRRGIAADWCFAIERAAKKPTCFLAGIRRPQPADQISRRRAARARNATPRWLIASFSSGSSSAVVSKPLIGRKIGS